MTTNSDAGLLDAVDTAVASRTDDIVAAATTLVGFETESIDLSPGSTHHTNDEAELQAWIADRLQSAGCEIDQWEPDAADLRDHPLIPPWHHWRGRPITVGTLRGGGTGRSLIVNGHIDVVGAGDPTRWTSPPFAAEVRGDRLYGRGVVDMKGGVAAALIAVDTLARCGVRLAGDLIFQAVPDEELGGMGTIAAMERGYRADAAILPECTDLDLCIATRGVMHARVTARGRSAHAEINQPHWSEGGGVNANHKAFELVDALLRLRDRRGAITHSHVSSPTLEITGITGGQFVSNFPEECEVTVNATYLPSEADGRGFGSALRAELERVVALASDGDDWLAAHPPEWTWLLDYPPSEIDTRSPIVHAAVRASEVSGRPARLLGLDSGYDGALMSSLYGIPAPAFGPGEIEQAHATDESVEISKLVDAARAYARLFVQWCGTV